MRPGSNKRMRGRNRRGPNPLARSYESNGPDVKVRGTAQHIADRYLQLARDAQSSGDPVTAENYFQHAEHYLRIIAAAQEQMQAQYGYRPPENANDEDGDGEEGEVEGFAAPYGGGQQNGGGFNGQQRQGPRPPVMNGPDGDDPQPPMFSAPRERFDNRNQRDNNWNRQNRDGNRFDNNRQNNNRHDNNRHDNQRRDNYRRDAGAEGGSPDFAGEGRQSQPRGYGEGERQGFEQRRFDRQNGQGGQAGQGQHGQGQHGQGQHGAEGREERQPRFERAPRPAQEEQVLPSFITAPVRPPVAVSEPEPVEAKAEARAEAKVEAVAEPAAEGAAPAPRRRGRPRRVVEAAPEAEGAAAPADETSPVSAK